MRKSVKYLVVGLGMAAAGAVVAILIVFYKPDLQDKILAVYQEQAQYRGLTIRYPLNKTLFPPEIVPPTFRWKDSNPKSDTWLVTFKFQDDKGRMNFLAPETQWTPGVEDWQTIKSRSLEKPVKVAVLGVNRSAPKRILSGAHLSISTSKDEVGAPLFYREVNLPFIDAVKDPSNIRWRFGTISSQQQPPIVLEKLPVCGNCHSFSANGSILGMDVDYANDKGSYAIARITKQIVLSQQNIITWSDYKRDDMEPTFGLLSQVSPDGKYAVSTVKDRSVFVPKPELAFSQLFFPIKGILAVYYRDTQTYRALPGADDPEFVQSNPTWSPDGKYIIFAKSKVHRLKHFSDDGKVLLTQEECREFLKEGKTFLFDLYRIPFNDGRGGKPEPLEGASHNGMSNYFAKYSPDGKWIIFCQAKSFMLLQPDSEMYIIPAEGGRARRLRGNTHRMNSWHSWSPNSRWLVFTSKANSAYTQLFLTHIDEQGHSTPPVVLSHLTSRDRAANIPEFVNVKPTAITKIREQFVDDISHLRAAVEFFKAKDYEGAARECRKALELNPGNVKAHNDLATVLLAKGLLNEGITHLTEAIRLDPNSADAHYNLGLAMLHRGKPNEAIKYWSKTVQLKPNYPKAHINLGVALARRGKFDKAIDHYLTAVHYQSDSPDAHYNLGEALAHQGKIDEAISHYSKAVQLKPDFADAHYNLGVAMASQGKLAEAVRHWSEAVQSKPDHAKAHYHLGVATARQGKLDEAIRHYLIAVQLTPEDAEIHYKLGIALAHLGRLDEAIRHWSVVVRLKPDHVKAHVNLGVALARRGKLDEAVRHHTKAVQIKPDYAEAHLNLGLALAHQKKIDQAIRHLAQATRLTPNNIEAFLNLGVCYAELGRFSEAVLTTKKALSLARAAGKQGLTQEIEQRIDLFMQHKPYRPEISP